MNFRHIFLFVLLAMVECKCPEKWSYFKSGDQEKCIKYFDHPTNFSEAQYICTEIYSGDLVSINSLNEQKALVQYLHNEIGLKRSPVTWIGGRILSSQDKMLNGNVQLKWIDGTEAKFDNFGDDFDESSSERCTKILSLMAKGKQSTGLWTADNCSLRDSGFVCQMSTIVNDPERGRSGHNVIDPKNQYVIKQLIDQFSLIKELCENQIKLIEKLSISFQSAMQSLSKEISNEY